MTATEATAAAWRPMEECPALTDVVTRPGTRVVLLGASKDVNAKVTLVLLDAYGPAHVVKVPTTGAAAEVVRNEGAMLTELAAAGLGSLAATVPRALGYLSAEGLPALVTTSLTGVPMAIRYHGWRHTRRRRRVRADFAAAGEWLAQLQRRTASAARPVVFFQEALDAVAARFPDHPDLPALRGKLALPAARLATHRTPRTVVHGDYWFGNLLLSGDRVVGVVDWESGEPAGEPLRDVARFAVSYSLYLDRHTRAGRRVRGHRGLSAGEWGAGLAYAVAGPGWFPAVVREYVGAALERLGLPADLAREVLLAGIADVAATADHPDFAKDHLDVLVRLLPEVAKAGS